VSAAHLRHDEGGPRRLSCSPASQRFRWAGCRRQRSRVSVSTRSRRHQGRRRPARAPVPACAACALVRPPLLPPLDSNRLACTHQARDAGSAPCLRRPEHPGRSRRRPPRQPHSPRRSRSGKGPGTTITGSGRNVSPCDPRGKVGVPVLPPVPAGGPRLP
jgi:hypothetical protein